MTIISLCIAGEASCTIVHNFIEITQMNTAVTTTVIYASDSTTDVNINNIITAAIHYIISCPNLYQKTS